MAAGESLAGSMSGGPPAAHDAARRARRRRRLADAVLTGTVRASAVGVVLMLATLLVVLGTAAAPSVRQFGFSFFTTTEWRANELERPKIGPDGSVVIEDGETVMETIPPTFGALPVIYGTAASSIIALVVAVPLSFGAALFLVRIAPRLKIAGIVSFLIEFLAAVPSLAFGIWGLFVLAPFLQHYIEPGIKAVLGEVPGFRWLFYQTVQIGGAAIERPIPLTGRDLLCGGLVLAIMVIPIITAVSRDVLRAVPRAQIEGTLALGATWWQSCAAMLRYSKSGLFGAVMLGLARAAGETMAVTMVIGNNNQIAASPFAPAQSMASLLANEFAEASSELHRSALLEVALILLVMSLLFNVIARTLIVGRGQRAGGGH